MANIQNVAIFGSTGMTGLCVLDETLSSGLKVKLLLRDPTKLPTELLDKVEYIKGDVTNAEDVDKTIAGVDGVVVVLGTRKNLDPTTEMSRGLENIVASMKKHGIKVISVCLSAFLFYEPDKVPPKMRDLNEDHVRMLKVLQSSGLDYVAVCPPHIGDDPKGEYLVKNDGRPNECRVISKFELAEFLVKSLFKSEHYGHIVGIACKSG